MLDQNKTVGFVDAAGVYHPGVDGDTTIDPASSQYRAWDHDRQRAEHQYELLQPWDRNGKPNAKFIEAYPEESKINGMRWEDRNDV